MTKPIVTNAPKQTPVNLGPYVNALMENHLERDQVINDTYKDIAALNTEFSRRSLEQLAKCSDLNKMGTWISEEGEKLKEKTAELWVANDKKLEALGFRK